MKNCLKTRIFSFASIALLNFQAVFANDFALSDGQLTELKEKGVISHSATNDDSFEFKLCPKTELSSQLTTLWTNKEKPVFCMESLYLMSKEELRENSADKENSDVSLDGVCNIMRSVSKMKGMMYYSNSHKEYRVLYEDSKRVKSAADQTPVSDNLDGPTDGLEYFALMNDTTFGENIYKLDYSQRENEVSLVFSNLENLKFGPITCVKKENLKIGFCVIEFGEYFLVYYVAQVIYPSISFLEKTFQRSFNARIDAIHNWFCTQF